jgi:hypothetical protein
MTPHQLSYLTKRHRQRQEREQLLTGLLASVTANYSMCAPKEPLCPADFMPRKQQRQELLSDEDLAAQFSAVLLPRSVPSPR